MIRTNVVKLSVIPAVAYRQKLTSGGSGIVIMRPDKSQPGIASVSKTSGEAIPSANTNTSDYPKEAFAEALALTYGMPYKKMGGVKVTPEMVAEPAEEAPEDALEIVEIDSSEYQKLVEQFTDKNGKLSYSLINKDFIKFAKSSLVVRDMMAAGESAPAIRDYIVRNKIRNITGNQDLTDAQVDKMVELLDEVSPQGVFKELNGELRKMLGKGKR